MNIDFDDIGQALAEQLTLLSHTGSDVGRGWVPIEAIAWNTYGSVTGIDSAREPVTMVGYIVHSEMWRIGFGCTGRDQIAVYLAAEPDVDPAAAEVVYVDLGAVVTVLDPPPGDPPGEGEPWRRMRIEQQVVEGGRMLGVTVREIPGDPNPTYQVDDDEPTALSRVADLLLVGGYARSVGRARPIPNQNSRRPS